MGYAAWLLVPAAAFYFAIALPPNPVTTVLIVVTVVLQLFVWLWIFVCLMRATALLLSNKPIDHDVLSTQALRRIQPVLAVVSLQALIVLGGTLLLIIPGIIFWVWYSLAQTAAGLDDKRPVESLTFSRALVQGRFTQVLWRLIAGPIVIGLLCLRERSHPGNSLARLLGVDVSIIFSDAPPLWSQIVQSIVDIFFIPLFLIYTVLLYQDLKSHPLEKETLSRKLFFIATSFTAPLGVGTAKAPLNPHYDVRTGDRT